MRAVRRFAMLAATIALLSACGPGGPETYPVAGTVTFDGEPLATGEVVFKSADGNDRSCAGTIEKGAFDFRSTAGQKRVEIWSFRVIPGKFTSPGPGEPLDPMQEQIIPGRYNSKTRLEVEVTPSGANEFQFALQRSTR